LENTRRYKFYFFFNGKINPASSAVNGAVVIVPIALLATTMPDFIASLFEIDGQLLTTSLTAEVISTDKSIMIWLNPF